jgi:hypothetical protein
MLEANFTILFKLVSKMKNGTHRHILHDFVRKVEYINAKLRDRRPPPPQIDRTVTFTTYLISGHEPQRGLDTKTDRLTDRQP